ncbi:hypothetical protein [Winogradskyella flava]|uniref:DUF1579 domain-containing protein n=1 Tax=Winogradskyella flava TaxID=1884876 RepID=A0A842ISZ3_9FLAO|nr:hypothetical protein [Winogradskyella flava]MBC2846011.1 hypothetical protein [Winogradskyella flava]
MKNILLSLLITLTFLGHSQNNETFRDTLKSVAQLNFMKGSWKGNGWIFINREKKEFSQSEIIKSKNADRILVIDGLGHAKDSINPETKKVIHDAFGIISFNEDLDAITMLSFSSTGDKMENELRLIGEKQLEWSFKDERGGTIRFREDFTTEGVWEEKGEYSFDGEKWFPFFYMKLERQ